MYGVNNDLQATAKEFLTNKHLAEQRYANLLREVEELERRVSKVAKTFQNIDETSVQRPIAATPTYVHPSDENPNVFLLDHLTKYRDKIIPILKRFFNAHSAYKEICSPGVFYSPAFMDYLIENKIKSQQTEIIETLRKANTQLVPSREYFQESKVLISQITHCFDLLNGVEQNAALLTSAVGERDNLVKHVTAYRVSNGAESLYCVSDALLSNFVLKALSSHVYDFLVDNFGESFDKNSYFIFTIEHRNQPVLIHRTTLNMLRERGWQISQEIVAPFGRYLSSKSLIRYRLQEVVYSPKSVWILYIEFLFITALKGDKQALETLQKDAVHFLDVLTQHGSAIKLAALIQKAFLEKSQFSVLHPVSIVRVFVLAALEVPDKETYNLLIRMIQSQLLTFMSQTDLAQLGLKMPVNFLEAFNAIINAKVKIQKTNNPPFEDSIVDILQKRFNFDLNITRLTLN